MIFRIKILKIEERKQHTIEGEISLGYWATLDSEPKISIFLSHEPPTETSFTIEASL